MSDGICGERYPQLVRQQLSPHCTLTAGHMGWHHSTDGSDWTLGPGDELTRLRRWKSEASPVLDGLQELGRALGVPLGTQVTGPAALAAAQRLSHELDDIAGGYEAASAYLDRFRDVVADCLGHVDQYPGDDGLLAELREHFGRTGPEPTRWRDFVADAEALRAERMAAADE